MQPCVKNNEIGRNTIRMVLSSLKLGEVEKGHSFLMMKFSA